MGKLPKGMVSRSVELLKLAAKVGSEQLSSNEVVAKQMEQAKLMVDSLGKLKGAAMKVGQMLSMDFSDLLPPEVRHIFEQLQASSSHFMSEQEVRSILAQEIPQHIDEIKNLSPEPIAAASIGQVHSAEWQGKKIVIKIQYPGVAASIDSDITLLKGAINSLLLLARKKMDLDPLFSELRVVFKNETDYELELKNLIQYKENLKKYEAYKCPEAYPEISTKKIIAMSFEKGVRLSEWIQSNPSFERKEALGRKILDLYAIEFFENALVQSDPNPGNFFVTEDDRIVLLDFGAVKKYERSFVSNYITLMQFAHKRDLPATVMQAIEMGFVDDREEEETKELFFTMLRSSLCAFDKEKQPFDFGDKNYFEQTKVTTREFGKVSKYTPPPFELIFLHRKLVGVFGILRELDLRIDLDPYWKKAIKL